MTTKSNKNLEKEGIAIAEKLTGILSPETKKKLEGQKILVKAWGRTYRTKIHLAQYLNNRTAIQLCDAKDGSPYATLTVNIPEAALENNEVLVKTWSENEPVAKSAMATGLFRDTGKRVQTGFVEAEVWEVV